MSEIRIIQSLLLLAVSTFLVSPSFTVDNRYFNLNIRPLEIYSSSDLFQTDAINNLQSNISESIDIPTYDLLITMKSNYNSKAEHIKIGTSRKQKDNVRKPEFNDTDTVLKGSSPEVLPYKESNSFPAADRTPPSMPSGISVGISPSTPTAPSLEIINKPANTTGIEGNNQTTSGPSLRGGTSGSFH
jgi:hypothetical protein